MRGLALLTLLSVFAGCASRIDRNTLDTLYQDSAMSPGVLSSVPLQIDPQAPPTIVNWWYTGSEWGDHFIVSRQLNWDTTGQPRGRQRNFRIDAAEIKIAAPFSRTEDSTRWIPLHEATRGAVPPPRDLATTLNVPKPETPQPVVSEPVAPDAIEPSPVPRVSD